MARSRGIRSSSGRGVSGAGTSAGQARRRLGGGPRDGEGTTHLGGLVVRGGVAAALGVADFRQRARTGDHLGRCRSRGRRHGLADPQRLHLSHHCEYTARDCCGRVLRFSGWCIQSPSQCSWAKSWNVCADVPPMITT